MTEVLMPIRRDDRGFSPLARRCAPPGPTTFSIVRDALRQHVGSQYEPDVYVDDEHVTVRFIPLGGGYSSDHVDAAVARARAALGDAYAISVLHPNTAPPKTA